LTKSELLINAGAAVIAASATLDRPCFPSAAHLDAASLVMGQLAHEGAVTAIRAVKSPGPVIARTLPFIRF